MVPDVASLPDEIQRFARWLAGERRASPRTSRAYLADLASYAAYLSGVGVAHRPFLSGRGARLAGQGGRDQRADLAGPEALDGPHLPPLPGEGTAGDGEPCAGGAGAAPPQAAAGGAARGRRGGPGGGARRPDAARPPRPGLPRAPLLLRAARLRAHRPRPRRPRPGGGAGAGARQGEQGAGGPGGRPGPRGAAPLARGGAAGARSPAPTAHAPAVHCSSTTAAGGSPAARWPAASTAG